MILFRLRYRRIDRGGNFFFFLSRVGILTGVGAVRFLITERSYDDLELGVLRRIKATGNERRE